MTQEHQSKTISFRINAVVADEIQQRAQEENASSIHNYCRDLLLTSLANISLQEEINSLHKKFEEISNELVEFREDMYSLATKMMAILCDLSEEDAALLLHQEQVQDDIFYEED